jgi:3-dehydroquinate synthase
MKEIKVKASKEYSVFIAPDITGLQFIMDNNKIKNVFIVTDRNVYNIYNNLFSSLKDRISGIKVIEPGEENKIYNTVEDIYLSLMEIGANRKTTIAAVGGGVVGDLAGFAAATYLRGIGIIHIPTSLIAQCDSSIGGKTGYNFKDIKNVVGTFYQPDFVYVDINFLKTLKEKEYSDGIAEIIKYGFACDRALFQFIEENKKAVKERESDKLLHIIHECIRIKAEIVGRDEKDTDLRQVLNFGHTIGHGIESISGFKTSHGEAVAMGMNIEAFIAVRTGKLKESEYNRLVNILKYFKLPQSPGYIDIDKLIEVMKSDKKRISNNIKFALPDSIGHAVIVSDIKQNLLKQFITDAILREISL